MKVRKVRNKNEISKITLTATEVAIAKKMGLSVELYAQKCLVLIAKQRRWKWFFRKNNT